MTQFLDEHPGGRRLPLKHAGKDATEVWDSIHGDKKEQILKRPKAFYEHASTLLDKDKNPIEGHAFERMWNLIFNPHLLG